MNISDTRKDLRSQMWQFMNSRDSFTRADLEANCPVGQSERHLYVKELLEEGSIREIHRHGHLSVFVVNDPSKFDEQKALEQFAIEAKKFTRRQLDAIPNVSRKAATRFFQFYKREGRITRVGQIGNKPLYTLLTREELSALAREKRQTPEGHIWTAMRISRRFTCMDLLAAVGEKDVKITKAKIQSYCVKLVEAGYLRSTASPHKRKQDTTYQLVRNTGPLPLEFVYRPVVVDPNEDRVVFVKGGNLE